MLDVVVLLNISVFRDTDFFHFLNTRYKDRKSRINRMFSIYFYAKYHHSCETVFMMKGWAGLTADVHSISCASFRALANIT